MTQPKVSPYQMWQQRGRPSAVFGYRQHCNDECFRVLFDPELGLLYLGADLEYYDMEAVVVLELDHAARTAHVTRTSCTSTNHWPALNGSNAPRTMQGSYRALRSNLRYLRNLGMMSVLLCRILGGSWTLTIARKAGQAADGALDRALRMRDDMKPVLAQIPWDTLVSVGFTGFTCFTPAV